MSIDGDLQIPTKQWRIAALATPSAVRYFALLVTVICSILLVAVAPRHAPMSVVLTIGSTAGCGVLALLQRRRAVLRLLPIVAAIGLVFFVSVFFPPRTSNDLWSYTMYGRIVAVHDANPYSSVPSDFRSDPFFHRVSPIWQRRASVFGPLWVGYAATDAALVGSSPLANRLFFQSTAALAATAVLVLVWRRTRSTAALVWLGLHPVFSVMAINGGHSDLVVGLAILVAVLLSSRRSGWSAGVVLGLAALVKITALLALVGVVLWAWRQGRRHVARTAMIGAAATVALGYLPFFGDASHVLEHADHTVTPASAWNWLADLLVGHDAGRGFLHPLAPNGTLDAISFAAGGLVVLVALALGWRTARASSPRVTVGTTTAAYTVSAQYAFPWYAVWAVPLFADDRPSLLGWIVWTQAALMLVALKLPIHPSGTLPDDLVRGLFTYLAPVTLLVAFTVAGYRAADYQARQTSRLGSTLGAKLPV